MSNVYSRATWLRRCAPVLLALACIAAATPAFADQSDVGVRPMLLKPRAAGVICGRRQEGAMGFSSWVPAPIDPIRDPKDCASAANA